MLLESSAGPAPARVQSPTSVRTARAKTPQATKVAVGWELRAHCRLMAEAAGGSGPLEAVQGRLSGLAAENWVHVGFIGCEPVRIEPVFGKCLPGQIRRGQFRQGMVSPGGSARRRARRLGHTGPRGSIASPEPVAPDFDALRLVCCHESAEHPSHHDRRGALPAPVRGRHACGRSASPQLTACESIRSRGPEFHRHYAGLHGVHAQPGHAVHRSVPPLHGVTSHRRRRPSRPPIRA